MNPCNFLQDFFAILQTHLTLVPESNRQIINGIQRRFDLLLQQRAERFVEDVHGQGVSHVIVFHMSLNCICMGRDNPILLDP
jgi:hypothetical protein